MLRDVRHSLLLIRRHPGHAIAVLLTLAVAIGAGTVVIALADHIVLRPLPFAGSERVVHVWETQRGADKYRTASYPDLRDWAAQSHSFEALALARSWNYSMDTPAGKVPMSSGVATPQWFAIQSVHPALGRFFNESEMRPGSNHVVVLSHETWRSRFGGDPRVLQRQIVLGGQPFQIIGVLPDRAWIYELDDMQIWTPLTAMDDNPEDRAWRGFVALGRLAPGASIESARQELGAIQQRLAKTYPKSNAEWGAGMELLRNVVAGPARKILFIFLASIALVLLIACANVANLALAFNSWRAREFSIRYALGAGGSHIARQILIESSVLALIGGAIGLGVAHGGLALFRAVAPSDIPRLAEVTIDTRVALTTIALSVVCAVLFGILPARAAARIGTVSGTRTTAGGNDLRLALVVGELALAFVLVTATGLMSRAFMRLVDWNPGFRAEGLSVVFAIGDEMPSLDAVEMFDRAAHAIRSIPGVTAVGQTSQLSVFGSGDGDAEFRVAGPAKRTKGSALWFDVSPDYFPTLGTPLVRGRQLADTDNSGSTPVALINETMARQFWGGADPVGAHITIMDHQVQIAGVVGDLTPFRPDEPTQPEIYFPKRQYPRRATKFVVRSALATATLERQVTELLQRQEPRLHVFTFKSVDDLARARRVTPRFNVVVISILSALAFVLAAIGIYGVVSFSIVSRTRDIAIRLAVGADPRRVVREILADGGKMLAAGLLIGVAGAIAVARFLAAFLFGLSPFDPLTWTAVSLAFAAIVIVACAIPARRAAGIDPAASLRVE